MKQNLTDFNIFTRVPVIFPAVASAASPELHYIKLLLAEKQVSCLFNPQQVDPPPDRTEPFNAQHWSESGSACEQSVLQNYSSKHETNIADN